MKKLPISIKALALVSLLAASGATLGACNKAAPRATGTLSIMAYNGGYGTEWLEDITNEFTKETGIVVTSETDSTILSKIESQLTDVSDYDIFMSHGLSWQNYASRDLLAPLDDLYSSTLDSGVTFESRLLSGTAELCQYENGVSNETHYYKVPFTQGAGGFVYNIDLFAEKGWTVPTTYDELKTLCAKIVSDTNGEIKPFAWSSARDYYWDYPIYEWWCEMDGLDAFNSWLTLKDSDGKYAKGYENFDPAGKFANFKKAFSMWYDLVGEHSEYANDKAYNASLLTAQNAFFTGKAAMIPYGQWAKKEIELATKKSFSFNVGMMPTPKANASTAKNYNFMVGYGDSMIVPKNSPNIELAKKFLAFMSSDYACKTFVKQADGPFLGFDYSKIDLSDIEATNTYVKSLHQILTNSVNFSTASNNPLVVNVGDTFIQPWVNNTRYYKECSSKPADNTPDGVIDKVFASAKGSWAGWVRNAGVE